VIGAAAHNAIETVAEFGSLNFLGVFAADGSEVIGVHQAGFQEVDVAVEFDPSRMKRGDRNVGAIERFPAELAVVAHIVNSENHGEMLKGRVGGVRGSQV